MQIVFIVANILFCTVMYASDNKPTLLQRICCAQQKINTLRTYLDQLHQAQTKVATVQTLCRTLEEELFNMLTRVSQAQEAPGESPEPDALAHTQKKLCAALKSMRKQRQVLQEQSNQCDLTLHDLFQELTFSTDHLHILMQRYRDQTRSTVL